MPFVNYRNGNYVVYFNTNTGDKIRITKENEYKPYFAENCDVTITDYCDGGCAFCYAGCGLNGKHGDLNASFFDTLHEYTELAINGNDLSHPDLLGFLQRMKDRHVMINVTVNQKHFEAKYNMLKELQENELIHGIGVSLVNPTENFLEKVKYLNNVIIHVINGVHTQQMFKAMYNHNLNILILGYKTTGRGQGYLDKNSKNVVDNQMWLNDHITDFADEFASVAFDNLAIKQLSVKPKVSKEMWDKHYMGDDGQYTFFINVVDGYFAKNSTSPIHYPLMDTVDEMFEVIRKAG